MESIDELVSYPHFITMQKDPFELNYRCKGKKKYLITKENMK